MVGREAEEEAEREIISTSHHINGVNSMDLRKIRVRNLKWNRRLFMPEPIQHGQYEYKMKMFEDGAMRIVCDYKKEEKRMIEKIKREVWGRSILM